MSNLLVGMLIGFKEINDKLIEIYLDNDIRIQTENKNLKNIKIGDYVVVYKNYKENKMNLKLLNQLV